MRFERVLRMNVSEAAGRARQYARVWLEREQQTRHQPAWPNTSDTTGARKAVSHRGRFFAGVEDPRTAGVWRARMGGAVEQVVSTAEKLCLNRFDLLGYRDLSFGQPIDWHLDPISGRRAPQDHWSEIDPLDYARVGDSKVIWELNRHQWLVHLALAYVATHEERYLSQVRDVIGQWMEANPPGIGINWSSSLEVSLRLIAWSWIWALLESQSKELTLLATLADGIAVHARHVERHLSWYFSPNTHLTGEALGLFYAGTQLSVPEAPRWRSLGERILVSQQERQILDDGVYFEQSTCYQRYAAEISLHFLILAQRNRVTVAEGAAAQLDRMIDFLVRIRRPDGAIPAIGDEDGGWLLPVERRTPNDARGLFASAAAWRTRGDWAWAAGSPNSELLWLLGPDAMDDFVALSPEPPSSPPSQLFPQGGYAVMRDQWTSDAHQMIFDVGPLGCPISAGHGHADLLAIQCTAHGVPYIVDAGTYSYADAPWRDAFRSTGFHSTLLLDGKGQAEPGGAFAWRNRPRASLRRWFTGDDVDFADAEHDAWRRIGVVHRRRVLFDKRAELWFVVDDLQGDGNHDVELRFQLAGHPITRVPPWVRIEGPGERGLWLGVFAREPLHARVIAGELNPPLGWISQSYGRREPAPMLINRVSARLPFRSLTLLVPFDSGEAPSPNLDVIWNLDGDPDGVSWPDGREVRFHDRGFIVAAGS